MEGDRRPGLHEASALRLTRSRGRWLAAIAALTLGALGLPFLNRVVRSWPERVAYTGPSMAPTLTPGDWLLVDPAGWAKAGPRPGDLIVLHDPRDQGRWLVKRVETVGADGRSTVLGDARDASTDSRTFGPVDPALVIGRPWFRYWPPARFGLIKGR